MGDRYDVVVVGSGYGGAIYANRMVRARRTVCLLEHGRERHAGEFPDTLRELSGELNVDGDIRVGDRSGLYRFHLDDDINVFSGCGLGGTSLVNANVSIRPDPRVFDDAHWPDSPARRRPAAGRGYARAEAMLRPVPYPATSPPLAKLEALEATAEAIGGARSPGRRSTSRSGRGATTSALSSWRATGAGTACRAATTAPRTRS